MPIYDHPCLIPVNDNLSIWRYLDFYKFKSLLETSSLFFCRADKFSDPFEGSLPARVAENRINFFKHVDSIHGNEFDETSARLNIEGLGDRHMKTKQATVINCWHINDTESDAMWRLYLKDNEGVAIQSNISRIKETISCVTESIGMSKVRYLNYENDIWYHEIDYPITTYNTLTPLVHKRIEFSQENEFRLLMNVDAVNDDEDFWLLQENQKGKFVKVNLNVLTESIYLPPTIDKIAEGKIKEMSRKYGYDFEFRESKLSKPPIY